MQCQKTFDKFVRVRRGLRRFQCIGGVNRKCRDPPRQSSRKLTGECRTGVEFDACWDRNRGMTIICRIGKECLSRRLFDSDRDSRAPLGEMGDDILAILCDLSDFAKMRRCNKKCSAPRRSRGGS